MIESVCSVVDSPNRINDVISRTARHVLLQVVVHGSRRCFAIHWDSEERIRFKVACRHSTCLARVPTSLGDKVLEVGSSVLSGELPRERVNVASFVGGPDFVSLSIELRELTQTG